MTGITGGIGSGKSTIAKSLIKRGLTVYDCDQEAKRIIVEDEEVRKAIIGLLGNESFVNGRYNTAYVAKRVFEDRTLLEQLNRIVHPTVRKDIVQKQPDFVESAILYEAGMADLCEKVIVVEAPEDVRIARTIARDYQGEATAENIDKVRARIEAQGEVSIQPSEVSHQPSEVRMVVNNDGKRSVEELAEEVISWCKK